MEQDRRAAAVGQAGEHVGPPARREPRPHRAQSRRPVRGRRDRGDEQPVAEQVLVAHPVGVGVVRVLVVHRLHERLTVDVRAPVHRVQVGHQPVAQPEEAGHDPPCPLAVAPRLAGVERAVAGVQPGDRREHAELGPADGELVVLVAEEVAADVVAPPAVADVARGRREVRLEVQRRPGDHRVAGEADRVAVAADPGVAGERQRPLPVVAPESRKWKWLSSHSGSSPGMRVTPPCCQSSHQKSTPSASRGWCSSSR